MKICGKIWVKINKPFGSDRPYPTDDFKFSFENASYIENKGYNWLINLDADLEYGTSHWKKWGMRLMVSKDYLMIDIDNIHEVNVRGSARKNSFYFYTFIDLKKQEKKGAIEYKALENYFEFKSTERLDCTPRMNVHNYNDEGASLYKGCELYLENR